MAKKKIVKKKTPQKKKKTRSTYWKRLAPLFVAFLFCILLAADIGSKYAVQKYIPYMNHEAQWYPYRGIGIFEDFFGVEFSLVHAKNYGAAWGVFSDYQSALMAFRIVFVVFLACYTLFLNRNRFLKVPLALILTGAIGNIIDYFVYGHVIDMFHFVLWGYRYPVFNVADSLICIGVASFFVVTLCEKNGLIKCRA